MRFFSTSISLSLLIVLTAIYGMCAAITALNVCISKAQQVGYLSPKMVYVPVWARPFPILLWAAWAVIFLLNWRYALVLFGFKFALKELSILENFGAWLIRPALDNEAARAVNTAISAADEIETMNQEWKNQLKTIEQKRAGKGYNNRQ